ncbi:hypothetical protein ABBQ32_000653 [Trebouxia sp. C0010 RCD-2024]
MAAKAVTKRGLKDLSQQELENKRVLVRVDLNVPLDSDSRVSDDTRIRAIVPTVRYLIDRRARVILASHLGRPKGPEERSSLKHVVESLSDAIGLEVQMAPDCIGNEVQAMVDKLQPGHVLLLENVRFHKQEEKNDPEFAKQLASLAEVYVNDAFGTAHRAHASTQGVTAHLSPCVGGFLMQKELDYLMGAVQAPNRPFCAIVGGSKVSTKIGVLEQLLEKCDSLILGGAMIFTFFKAQGFAVGQSMVEEEQIGLAKQLMSKAAEKGVKLLLPTDVVVADQYAADAHTHIVSADQIPDGWMGLDIGPDALKSFQAELQDCKTVIWNGPMGVFEMEAFAKGTFGIAATLATLTSKGCMTIIGGGDSVSAVEKAGVASQMSHISTGGGASLELLEGRVLPGVAALDDQNKSSSERIVNVNARSETKLAQL